ncbi:heterocycloanthracin/sonorensin family bacteriocin [Mesobacillus sp.]|uniref:heterocycloanthracin/sonorensin family bacteriocin n=1 Tax=Mesobacillus sp. TaxID=2675271 RepID=UPI0039EE9B67
MMNNFQNELQMLNVGDFQATQPVSWDQNQYQSGDERIFLGLGGFGGCFGFSCFFSCFGCGGCFRCGGCGGCGRCARCGGCGRCGGGGRCHRG